MKSQQNFKKENDINNINTINVENMCTNRKNKDKGIIRIETN